MYTRYLTSEETAKLSEAKHIMQRARNQQIEYVKSTLSSKLLGIVGIALSVIAPIIVDGGLTVTFFMLPLSIAAIFNKEER